MTVPIRDNATTVKYEWWACGFEKRKDIGAFIYSVLVAFGISTCQKKAQSILIDVRCYYNCGEVNAFSI